MFYYLAYTSVVATSPSFIADNVKSVHRSSTGSCYTVGTVKMELARTGFELDLVVTTACHNKLSVANSRKQSQRQSTSASQLYEKLHSKSLEHAKRP